MIIVSFNLGPIDNNTYLAGDDVTGAAVVIDPSFEPGPVLIEADRRSWNIQAIWLTHAHFDHIAGTAFIRKELGEQIAVGLHPADLPVWREDGGARLFGFPFNAGQEPKMFLEHGQKLLLGSEEIEVFHTPGHSPGHVVFFTAQTEVAFTGDLIFYRSVGRTDLPGASSILLAQSIRRLIYTLPETTRLLPGHGPETRVGDEMRENPYV